MFEREFRGVGDDALLAAIRESHTAEAVAAARTLAAIAELTRRRCRDDERAYWSCDGWDAAAAEVSTALGVSHGRASGQMNLAVALGELPAVAALFRAGTISARVVAAIVGRTALVTDAEVRARIDQTLASYAGQWDALSQYRLEQAIDVWVERIDPDALRRNQIGARGRDVQVGTRENSTGTAALWGRLYATDAALLHRRLTQMAHGVCEEDPRTLAQRRADALGALAAGASHLRCACGDPHCPAADPDGRAAGVVVHILADAEALAAQPDPAMSGDGSGGVRSNPPATPRGAAALVGGGALPTGLLAELIRDGARVSRLRRPPDGAEPRYRPSAMLAEFVRLRDLHCRFPFCDQPAEFCDIDHAIPWPLGPTHPSNLRVACRKHHMIKTFWTGPGGWSDRQFPDATIIWTSPTGQTFTTRPGSRLLFPDWDTATAPLPDPGPWDGDSPSPTERGLMMPRRRRTRDQDRARRIRAERALNELLAARNRPPPF